MGENDVDETIQREKALESFLCFLYVGAENPYYKAKPWNADFHSQGKHMRSLEILASSKKTEFVPLDKIKLAMESSLIQRPETLMFALAMCARQKKSQKLRAAAYYFLTEHCKEWKYFILFVKYASYLCKTEPPPTEGEGNRIGWGRGWKNAVNAWYVNRAATDLAILVGSQKGGHGWTHKDILRLSHMDIQSLDAEKRAIVKYVLEGREAALLECENDLLAKKQLDYLSFVDNCRRCKDPEIVASNIRANGFRIDHLHPETLKSREVWDSLVYNLDVRGILKHLSKMNRLGCLTSSSQSTEQVVQTLTRPSFIHWSKILPADVLAVLNLHEDPASLGRPPSRDVSALTISENGDGLGMKKERKKRVEERALDVKVRDALRTALHISRTVDITGGGKKTYIVAITMPPDKHRKHSRAQAGLSIALPLLNRPDAAEERTTIIAYHPRKATGNIAEITKDMSYDEALEALTNPEIERTRREPMPFGPIGWCYETRRKFDVFINVLSEPPSKKSMRVIRALKEATESYDARFINVVVNRGTFELRGDIWNEALTIKGFDPHVPFIVEAYVRRLF